MIGRRVLALAAALATMPAMADSLPVNPAVTQATIATTICRSGWAGAQRRASGSLRAVKRDRLRAIGETRAHAALYELDHSIPLSLGGAAADPANLALQPIAEARKKDAVERRLRRDVCRHKIPLAQAQAAIWRDWRNWEEGR